VLEVIKEVPFDQWEHWEREYIRWYRALGWKVVNIANGGDGGAIEMTPEIRAKISAANKGKPKSEAYKQGRREHYAKFGHPNQGKATSPETKERLRAALKGRPKSPATRAKMSASGGKHLKGKRQSPEHVAKCRAAKLGKKFTPEHSAKISAALKGKPKSDEARQRMSDAAKRRCARQKLTSAQNDASLQALLPL